MHISCHRYVTKNVRVPLDSSDVPFFVPNSNVAGLDRATVVLVIQSSSLQIEYKFPGADLPSETWWRWGRGDVVGSEDSFGVSGPAGDLWGRIRMGVRSGTRVGVGAVG